MTRLNIGLSTEIDEKLNDIAQRNGITKAEASVGTPRDARHS